MIITKVLLLKSLTLLKDMRNDAFSSVGAFLWYIMRALAITVGIWITYTVGFSLGYPLGYLVLIVGGATIILTIYALFTQHRNEAAGPHCINKITEASPRSPRLTGWTKPHARQKKTT